MNKFSPGIVESNELLARFVLLDMHLDKRTRKPKPNLFTHIATRGCSIQRDSRATSSEISGFLSEFLKTNSDAKWHSVLIANCGRVRGLQMPGKSQRLLCVYDAVEKKRNPSHGEIYKTRHVSDDGDLPEMRRLLMRVFDADNPIPPSRYRSGAVWGSLSPELKSR